MCVCVCVCVHVCVCVVCVCVRLCMACVLVCAWHVCAFVHGMCVCGVCACVCLDSHQYSVYGSSETLRPSSSGLLVWYLPVLANYTQHSKGFLAYLCVHAHACIFMYLPYFYLVICWATITL